MSGTKKRPVFKELIYRHVGWILLGLVIVFGEVARTWIVKKVSESDFSIASLAHDSSRDQQVLDLLTRLMYETNADRAYMFRFHNGGHFVGNDPFKKISCMYEVVRLGVSREIMNEQNIPLSSVPEFMTMVTTEPSCFEIVVEKLDSESIFQSMLRREGIKYLLMCRLMKDGEIFGIIGIDYLEIPNKPDTGGPCKQTVNMLSGLIELEF